MMILYKYMSAERCLSFFQTLKLRFTPPMFFNDPLEARPYLFDGKGTRTKRSGIQDDIFFNDNRFGVGTKLLVALSRHLGLAAFSTDPESILMWSHYASMHTGVVIGFDSKHDFFRCGTNSLPREVCLGKVRYSSKRPSVSANDLRRLQFKVDDPTWDGWIELVQQRRNILFTKSDVWRYEKEWRLIKQLRVTASTTELHYHAMRAASFEDASQELINSSLIPVPPECVRLVVFGARHQVANMGGHDTGLEEALAQALKAQPSLAHVRFESAFILPNKYKVIRHSLDDLEIAKKHMHPQSVAVRKFGFGGRASVD